MKVINDSSSLRKAFTKEQLNRPYNEATTLKEFIDMIFDTWDDVLGIRYDASEFFSMDNKPKLRSGYGPVPQYYAWLTSKRIRYTKKFEISRVSTSDLLSLFKGLDTGTFNHDSFWAEDRRGYMMGDFFISSDLPNLKLTNSLVKCNAEFLGVTVNEYLRNEKLNLL